VRRGGLLLWIAVALVIALLALAALAPAVAPYDPLAQSILARMKGPSASHWLGTDQFGRDLLSRIIYGLRATGEISASALREPMSAAF
jgi:peptide/nickel transport system permease protein